MSIFLTYIHLGYPFHIILSNKNYKNTFINNNMLNKSARWHRGCFKLGVAQSGRELLVKQPNLKECHNEFEKIFT